MSAYPWEALRNGVVVIDANDARNMRFALPAVPESDPHRWWTDDGVAMSSTSGRWACPEYPRACSHGGNWPHVYFRFTLADDDLDDSYPERKAQTMPSLNGDE